jgi:hypothetical protein
LYRTGPAAVLILGLALALASCGGGGSGTQSKTSTVQAKEARQVVIKPQEGAATLHDSHCAGRLGDFLDRMNDLRQSLLAGLSYSEYVVRVRAIRAAYEAVPVDRLDVACLAGAAADAEDAFNQYLRAANAWGECAATAGCAASEVEGKLQHRWRLASQNLDAAEGKS